MTEGFFEILTAPEIPFLRMALLAGLISSIPLGISGTVVVSRNISSIAGAIAHAVLGGVGFALYAGRVWGIVWLSPLAGAFAGAFLAAGLIYLASLYAGEREDTVISGVWALGMSSGLLFIAATPGYVDLQGYLFGNILLATQQEIYLSIIFAFIITLITVIFFRPVQALLFDSEFAVLRGIRVKFLYFLLLLMIASTVVLMVNIAGVILLIALLSLPAATAGNFVRSLASMMTVSVLLAMFEITLGLYASFRWDLPAGPLTVIIAVIFYIVAVLRKKIAVFRRVKNG